MTFDFGISTIYENFIEAKMFCQIYFVNEYLYIFSCGTILILLKNTMEELLIVLLLPWIRYERLIIRLVLMKLPGTLI